MSARVHNEGRSHRGAPGGRGGVSPARRAAFEILRRVEEEDAFASILLANLTEELSAADRALCYELVLGVLRWQLWLDRALEYYARRRADELDAPVRRALRLGLYQLRFLSRIPASAAVNESVNIAHEVRLRSATGFINAVLRRATREPDHDPAEAPDIADAFERIAIKTSHPVWLIERWSAAFGADEAEAFARSNNQMPPNAFRLNPLKSTGPPLLERLREAGVQPVPSRVAPGAWRSEGSGGALLLRTLAQEGLIYIQDEASQLVAHALEARPGERVLDACAAPGSKTTHVAAHGGARMLIVAGDRYEHRLRTVRESALRQGLRNIDLIALDAEKELPFAPDSFDRVLVDAPLRERVRSGATRKYAGASQPPTSRNSPRANKIFFSTRRASCVAAGGWCIPPAPSKEKRMSM